MLIEKINENKIRCCLTQSELDERKLKISELAYGGNKAKKLLEEMIAHAKEEFGFYVEKGNPLMIEAAFNEIGLIITITKISEMNLTETTSNSSNHNIKNINMPKNLSKPFESIIMSDEFANKVKSLNKNSKQTSKNNTYATTSKIYTFTKFNDLMSVASTFKKIKIGHTTLYKNNHTKEYVLVTHLGDLDAKTYTKFCNMLSEYATQIKSDGPNLAFLEEHCDIILNTNALETLAKIC